MAIVVEDGTVVSGANSYVTEAELTTYATNRGVTISGTNSELLYKAMDYLEGQSFIGIKYSEAQPLQWPREQVWIDGYYIERTIIPTELKNAQMIIALAIDAGYDPLSTIERSTKRETVDVVTVEYMDNASAAEIIRSIPNALKKLVMGYGGFRVVRA